MQGGREEQQGQNSIEQHMRKMGAVDAAPCQRPNIEFGKQSTDDDDAERNQKRSEQKRDRARQMKMPIVEVADDRREEEDEGPEVER